MSDQARISLNVHDISLEIIGSESFVSDQIEHFREAIQEALVNGAQPDEEAQPEPTAEPPPAPHQEPTEQAQYTNVLHVESDKVRILKKIPGSTTSKRAVNTALVYLWAKRSSGLDSVPFTDLRDLCRDQGCLDKPNFAAHMKSARQWIIIEGTKGSSAQTAKLTMPGVERAEELLQELNGD